jgi:hypothetical protein
VNLPHSRRFEIAPETPRPTRTRVAHLKLGSLIITAIMRHWKPGDSGEDGRCRLCPKCHASEGGCLIVLDKGVSRAEAPLYDSHGDRIQEWVRRITPGETEGGDL